MTSSSFLFASSILVVYVVGSNAFVAAWIENLPELESVREASANDNVLMTSQLSKLLAEVVRHKRTLQDQKRKGKNVL